MVLELHVWGAAFGLPSLDPECLAAIAYFTQALPRSEWTVVSSSPSAVPTRRLPALHNPQTNSWTASLPSILTALATNPPPNLHSPDSTLTPSQLATSTAYTSYIRTSCPELLSLSLYASSANWSAVRPLYALPFPLGWTEIPPLRRAWIALSAGSGIDLLDAEDAERSIPPPAQEQQQQPETGLPLPNKKKGIAAQLMPEQKSRIRLEALVCSTLNVLADLKRDRKWFLASEEDGRPTSLDCVAFGYLALMVCPDLPRPWLRDVIVERYPGLREFVGDMTAVCFGDGVSTTPREESALGVAGRFVEGTVRNVPLVGEGWRRWRDGETGGGVVLAGGSVLALLVAVGVVLLRRGGGRVLGSPVQRWTGGPSRGLGSFGAAGALFAGLFAGESGIMRGMGSVQTEVQSPFGGKVDGVEVQVDVDVD